MTDPGTTPDAEPPPGAPRWVKVLALLVLLLALVFVVLHLTGNSVGGPGRHLGLAELSWP
ncbi:hypothetical protein [Blastococcus sp. LR1]|uniref:hypothetical protein n=1 Tax=Blastococcus sp. LR1 TaxID=2877000 RepID=UPI001CC9DC91|nr:hypothetical protein [Blastococcus sp. LR1]MCA0144061.1 hypothetical protein [Blastococcus sp. LR1]